MIKYCFITDEETGTVQLGVGCSDEYYKEIGMKQRDVEQSEVDFQWYLAEKCPHYTDEEKLAIAKEEKYKEANNKANYFLDHEALFELYPDFHIETTQEHINTFATAANGIERGIIPYQEWTSKEDNKRQLNAEECLTVSFGIGAIQNEVWNNQYYAYKTAIDKAQTVAEVERIVINYVN
ncbi:hypothetical protein IKE67_09100 [bacterium]|nr:hypothetical protein [bacterium]